MTLCLALATAVLGCRRESQETVVGLREVSAFEVPGPVHWDFVCGQEAPCAEQPDPNVTAYPSFVSDTPLFGGIHVPRELHRGLRGRWYRFALDESGGTGQGYDRLHLDLNGDLDLTNDVPVKACANPPTGAFARNSWIERQVCFDFLDIVLPVGTEGMRPLEVMPRFAVDRDGGRVLSLVTTRAFRGRTTLAGRRYDIWLGHNRFISGWFDQPSTAVHLVRDGDFDHREEASLNRLMEWHRIGGADYCLSASPSGDRLIIRRYRGPYGLLKTRAGTTISGTLYSGEALVWIGGGPNRSGNRKTVNSFRIPVGDYTAGLEIYHGDLHLSTGGNIHVEGQRSARTDGPLVLGVKIREDKPFMLDLSARPEVLFASPGKGDRVARGQEFRVDAVLLDPELDLMVTDLEQGAWALDLPEMQTLSLATGATGAGVIVACGSWLLSRRWRSRRRLLLVLAGLAVIGALVPPAILCVTHLDREYDDLSPWVIIARSDGQIVAEGSMPFG